MKQFVGPLIDDTNFPLSEEWKEGGADLEHQLLPCEEMKTVTREESLFRRVWSRYVRWSGFLALCAMCCALGIICYLCGRSDLNDSELGQWSFTRMNNGLYKRGDLVSFSAPHLLPERLVDWKDSDFMREYNVFKSIYGRESSDDEHRYERFKKNLQFIHEHNEMVDKTFTMAPNQFTDLSFNEWSRQFTSLPLEHKRPRQTLWNLALVSNSSLPAEVNWHDKGCVTPVKDQAQCGSCWAFSSTGAIEGAVCAQTERLVSLSEQQLIDCSSAEGTHGCNGGFMDNAFQYVMDVGGICSEDEYPYHAKQEVCKKSCKNVAKISGIMDVPPGDVKALKAAIALHGPVAAGVQADRPVFQFYHKGVLNVECGKHLNHAILVTGYGMDAESKLPYWLVKNSWGSTWGDEGYIRLAMKHHGKTGECGILLAPSVPIINPDDIYL